MRDSEGRRGTREGIRKSHKKGILGPEWTIVATALLQFHFTLLYFTLLHFTSLYSFTVATNSIL